MAFDLQRKTFRLVAFAVAIALGYAAPALPRGGMTMGLGGATAHIGVAPGPGRPSMLGTGPSHSLDPAPPGLPQIALPALPKTITPVPQMAVPGLPHLNSPLLAPTGSRAPTSDAGSGLEGAPGAAAASNRKQRSAKAKTGPAGQSATFEEQQVIQSSQQSIAPMPAGPPPPATTAPVPNPPNLAAASSTVGATSFSPVFGGSGGVLGTIGQYFTSHGAPVSASAATDVTLNVGAKIPVDVTLYPLPYDLFTQVGDGSYVYFVSGSDVVVVDQDTDLIDAIIPDAA
jgi:hypothetical protein